jgi:WD40 repeat protein
MARSWQTVRVFISSTFRDMHAERDHLIRFVFPELKERCRKIHVHLIDVDLRWGVTEKDAQEGKALEICLDEIDTCRPYFLGLLGHRYGYVPHGHHHSITAQEIYHGVLHNDLPKQVVDLSKIIEGKLEGKQLSDEQRDTLMRCYVWDAGKRKYMVKEGITAEESAIIQSAFQQYAAYQKDRSFFFFRKESLTATLAGTNRTDFFEQNPEDRVKLEALKQEIRDACLPWFEYDDIEAFGQRILETLWKRIENEIGQEILAEKDWLEEELEFHELYIAGLTRRFVGRRDLLDRMHGFLEHDDKNPILVVTGEPGCGKSALIARFSEEARHRHTDWLVIPHFVGASPDSTIIRQVLRRVCMHIYNACDLDKQMQERISQIIGNDEQAQKQRQEIQKEYTIPDDYKELAEKFPEFLRKASKSHRVLIILDAANQLDKSDDAHAMRWLPQPIPENVSFVISTPAGEVYDALMAQRTKPAVESMHGLIESEIKEFVNDYLREISKDFPNQEGADTFFGKVKNGNPLYIIVALEELRVFGRFDEVSWEIQKLPEDVPSLFGQMLERIERDYQPYPGLVMDCVSYIACGRYGMASEELQTLLKTHAPRLDPAIEPVKLPDMLWARLHRTFGAYLINRAGVTDFFHTQIKDAVGRRYLGKENERNRIHKTIADYFETRWREPYTRALSELPHQRTKAHDWDGLETILTDLYFIEAKCAAGMTYDLITDYTQALDGLPEAQKEKEERRKRDERMQRYIREIIEYARKWSDARDRHAQDPAKYPMPKPEDIPLPEIIPSVRPWTDEEIEADTQRIINNPTRLDRIKLFFQFVNSEAHNFVKYAAHPLFCIQQAYNSADAGPVHYTATKILDNDTETITILRKKSSLPPFDPHPGILRTLDGHTRLVSAVSLTPDGRRAVSGSEDKTLLVWDVETGECQRILEGHSEAVTAVCITPDGRKAVSGGSGAGILRVWDLQSNECLNILKGHSHTVAVCITPDGRRAISGGLDKTLRIWDLQTGECQGVLEGHISKVIAVCIMPDGRRVVSGCEYGTLRAWDIETGEYLRIMEAHLGFTAVCITPDGRRAVSGGDDTKLQVWDLQTGECLRILEGHTDWVSAVCITQDGCRVVSGCWDGTLRVWDIQAGKCQRILKGHSGVVTAVCITQDGRKVVSGSGHLRIWDNHTGEFLRTLEGHIPADWVRSVCITPDGRRVVSGGDDTILRVWDIQTGECLRIMEGHPGGVSAVCITPDGRMAVSGCSNETLRVWDLQTGECLRIMEGHSGIVTAVCITPDGCLAVLGYSNATLRVWDLQTGECQRIVEGYLGSYHDVGITPDGRRVVSGSGSLRMWDIPTGECLRILGRSGGFVCITQDARRVVAGSRDGTLRVWDIQAGACIVMYRGNDPISAFSMARNGRDVVIGTKTGQVVFARIGNITQEVTILTATRLWLFDPGDKEGSWSDSLTCDCIHCGQRFTPETSILDVIAQITQKQNLSPAQSPCLKLPQEAWDDPRLLSQCPHCHQPLKFNPFVVENRERY